MIGDVYGCITKQLGIILEHLMRDELDTILKTIKNRKVIDEMPSKMWKTKKFVVTINQSINPNALVYNAYYMPENIIRALYLLIKYVLFSF